MTPRYLELVGRGSPVELDTALTEVGDVLTLERRSALASGRSVPAHLSEGVAVEDISEEDLSSSTALILVALTNSPLEVFLAGSAARVAADGEISGLGGRVASKLVVITSLRGMGTLVAGDEHSLLVNGAVVTRRAVKPANFHHLGSGQHVTVVSSSALGAAAVGRALLTSTDFDGNGVGGGTLASILRVEVDGHTSRGDSDEESESNNEGLHDRREGDEIQVERS